MKNTRMLLALSLSLGLSFDAGATQLNQQGANFTAYYGSDEATLVHWPSGVATSAASAKYVIASVDHNPLPSGATSYIVWVDGYHYGVQNTSFTLYSYNYNGVYLGSVSGNANGASGWWDVPLTVSSALGSAYAYFSVLAYIPASYNGRILGVTVTP